MSSFGEISTSGMGNGVRWCIISSIMNILINFFSEKTKISKVANTKRWAIYFSTNNWFQIWMLCVPKKKRNTTIELSLMTKSHSKRLLLSSSNARKKYVGWISTKSCHFSWTELHQINALKSIWKFFLNPKCLWQTHIITFLRCCEDNIIRNNRIRLYPVVPYPFIAI